MAGRIPQSFINDLIDRLDIVDVVGRRVTLKKSGKNYSGLCPFHDEKTPSFTVSPDKNFFHCFGCQESGTPLSFIMKFDRLEFVEAVEQVAADFGLEVPREQAGRAYKQVDASIYEVLKQAEGYYKRNLRGADTAIEYLKRRGLTGVIAHQFGIGYAPEGWQNLKANLGGVSDQSLLAAGLSVKNDRGRVYDRFRDRVMFPIRDTRGRVIGFGGRTLRADDGPKYLNSPETEAFHKGNELYGLYEARQALRHIDRLIVVEGYMDVVALAQFGIANSVATLGTATGTTHFNKLYRYTEEVVCCFDGDNAGRQAAWKALENALPALNENRQLKFVFLPDGHDPDSLIREQGKDTFLRKIDEAQGALDLLFRRLSEGLDLGSIDGQARFVGLAAPFVDKLPEGVLRTLVEQRVSQIAGLKQPLSAGQARRVSQTDRVNRLSKVSEYLLTIVVKHPDFWFEVPLQTRSEVIAVLEGTVLSELLGFVEQTPETDTEELIIRFGDDSRWGGSLTTLAERPTAMDIDGLKLELPEVCQMLLRNVRTEERRSSLQKLKSTQDMDELRKFWADRQT